MNPIFLLSYIGFIHFTIKILDIKPLLLTHRLKFLFWKKVSMMIKFIMAKYKNIPCLKYCYIHTVFMLQITKRSKEQYLDTLAACNYDKESSLLLLEFLSAAFSLLMITLQTNSSLSGLLP